MAKPGGGPVKTPRVGKRDLPLAATGAQQPSFRKQPRGSNGSFELAVALVLCAALIAIFFWTGIL